MEKPELASALAFFPQALKRVFHNRRRPSEVEDALRRRGVECLNWDGQLRLRFRHPIVPGNKFRAAAAFVGMCFLGGVNKKILERLEQQRAEPTATSIGVVQPIFLQNGHKKILRKVLRVLCGIAVSADERENGSPISSAKLGQRVARLLFFASVGGGKDKAPAGSYKLARSIFTPVASLPVHERTCGFSLFYTSNKR